MPPSDRKRRGRGRPRGRSAATRLWTKRRDLTSIPTAPGAAGRRNPPPWPVVPFHSGGSRVPSARRQLAGQLLSMFFSAVSRSSWPLIHAVMSFQKVPAPTAPGIWSDPSNRKIEES